MPNLIKKIPTFDYAIIVCEGHDTVLMDRDDCKEPIKVMRDNVLFEIGLCVMALGVTKVVLVSDSLTRMPDDLSGLGGELAVKRIIYRLNDKTSYEKAAS